MIHSKSDIHDNRNQCYMTVDIGLWPQEKIQHLLLFPNLARSRAKTSLSRSWVQQVRIMFMALNMMLQFSKGYSFKSVTLFLVWVSSPRRENFIFHVLTILSQGHHHHRREENVRLSRWFDNTWMLHWFSWEQWLLIQVTWLCFEWEESGRKDGKPGEEQQKQAKGG